MVKFTRAPSSHGVKGKVCTIVVVVVVMEYHINVKGRIFLNPITKYGFNAQKN